MTTIYTDGACSGNPGAGGWAWAIAPEGDVNGSGGAAHTTNQRMEMTAVLEALRANPGQITIVSDSTYVVNCWRDGWWERWQKNGWKNSKKEPVANKDLWEKLVEYFRNGELDMQWVKGHSGDHMNDFVDRLAVVAALGPFIEPVELAPPLPPDQSSLF